MKRRLRYEITVGVFVITAAVILGYISLKISRMRIRDGIDVDFLFSDSAGLVEDASVAVAGVEVGYVTGLSLKGNKALVSTRLRRSAGLRRNVRATIRSKSLLGEKYLEVVPAGGGAPLLRSGDLVADTYAPVQIDQMVAWIGRLTTNVDPEKAARLINALADDPEAARRIEVNLDSLLGELAALDSEKIKRFSRELRIRATIF